MKRFSNLALFFIIISATVIIVCCSAYKINMAPVSKESKEITFEVKNGQTFSTIGDELEKLGLIKSKFFYKLHVKLFKVNATLDAGKYTLNKNMGVQKIIDTLKIRSTSNPNAIKITFKEGINMRKVASLIEENTNYKKEDVYNLLKDTNYLDSLIKKYWFLSDDIKNNKIYYSLEGYLFPDTYEFQNKDIKIEEIFDTMLKHMESKLKPYQKSIKDNNYSMHQILTLSSIIELEAANSSDRNGVAGVFYNRLENNWSLGSDVTTYYGIKIDLNERDLYQSEIIAYNDYNTRNTKMAGKLPVSPICNPSIESIEAAINPTKHNYYYFVADKNKKTYFSKTDSEHNKTIKDLKDKGLWYQY